jgi:signal transduction histidine kinase
MRVGGDSTFADAERGWLADPARTTTADFEQRGHPFRRFRVYTAPVRHPRRHDDDGVMVLGRLFVARDVTQECEAERLRAALLSTVSHELRSPLTAIKGYTSTLLHGGPWDEETTREFLAIVDASADKLDHLVEGLLDAAQAEAGALRVEREPIRIEQIARRVIAQQSPLAPKHSLRLEAPDGLPLAEADPLRVEQVLTNLVENAIKYAPAGGPITIWIRDGAQLTVGVRDRGPGIPPEHADRLFERFYRVSAGADGAARGLGLGLAICKGLVEAHDGRIWMESAPGAGSTFTFTLPKLGGLDRDEVGIPLDQHTERSAA